MFNLPQQFDATRTISILETFSALVNTALTTTARLTALNLNTTLAILEDGIAMSNSLSGIKSLQDLTLVNNKISQPAIEKLTEYSRNVVEIVQQSGEEITNILQSEKNQISTSIARPLKKAA